LSAEGGQFVGCFKLGFGVENCFSVGGNFMLFVE
jgi:hypothetical protein